MDGWGEDGGVSVLFAHIYFWGVTGMGKGRRNSQLQVIPGLANFVRQLWSGSMCLTYCMNEVHHREWDTGELWHVLSGTGVFKTLSRFSLMGYSWLMGRKG